MSRERQQSSQILSINCRHMSDDYKVFLCAIKINTFPFDMSRPVLNVLSLLILHLFIGFNYD